MPPERRAAAVDLVVDAGGSGTRLGLARAGVLLVTHAGPTCNPHAGGAAAPARLAALVDELWAARPGGVDAIDVALFGLSEAATPARLGPAAERAAQTVAVRAARSAWVVNDIVPLVLGAGPGGGVAVVCGTGTGFAAIGPGGAWARASGLEWLLADEGGGTDIGLRGLRAVVRAADGRGARTALSAAAAAWCGAASPDALFETVHATARPKTPLAGFAPFVLRAAAAGDAVAAAILRGAATELALGVQAVAGRAGVAVGSALMLGGSLLVGDEPALRAGLLERLDERLEVRALPADPLLSVARAAERLRAAPGSLERVPLARRIA